MSFVFNVIVKIEKGTQGNPARQYLGRFIRFIFPKFWFSTFLMRLIEEWRRTISVTVQGKSMYVNLKDKGVSLSLYRDHIWEPYETSLLLKLLKQKMTFVDIGANRVFAFEPDPVNLDLLRKNIRINHCSNIIIEPRAVSDKSGHGQLYLSKIYFGDHRIYKSHDNEIYNLGVERSTISIGEVALDEYYDINPKGIDVVKMDIQGAEYKALQGMKETLKKNKDIIMVSEFWPHGLFQAGANPNTFLQELVDLGFMIYDFAILCKIPVSPKVVLTRLKGTEHTDLLFIRRILNV